MCVCVRSSLLWCKDVLALGLDGGCILLWDSYSFKSLAEYKEHDSEFNLWVQSPVDSLLICNWMHLLLAGAVTALDVSKDETTLVSGSKDKSIALWTLSRT